MTALRLSRRGCRVLVVEADSVGAGMTTKNHGIIHSGAMMARLHPETGLACRAAQSLFVQCFAPALTATTESVYFGERGRFAEFADAWERYGFAWQDVDGDEVAGWLRPELVRRSRFARVYEPIVDSASVLRVLARSCDAAGIPVVTGVRVDEVWIYGNEVRGVELATGERVPAASVVLAGGQGLHDLLRSARVNSAKLLRSRVAIMAAAPHAGLPVSLMCLDFGGPTVVPVTDQTALLGIYGGRQPLVGRDRAVAVPASMVAELDQAVHAHLRDDLVDRTAQVNWLGCKTEVADERSDAWGTQPGFAVLDHAAVDGISGLATIVTGKMTLAFHATRAALRVLGYRDEPLELPLPGRGSGEDLGEPVVRLPSWRLLSQMLAERPAVPGGSR
jgi:glycine/D-amino acid oxidase-like deaminating enzyme